MQLHDHYAPQNFAMGCNVHHDHFLHSAAALDFEPELPHHSQCMAPGGLELFRLSDVVDGFLENLVGDD